MRPLLADLAMLFHWPLTELKALPVEELRLWHDLALERYNKMNGIK